MSEAPNWPTPESQPEAINWKVVLGSIVGTLTIFTLGVFIVWLIYRHDQEQRNAQPSIPPALKQAAINEVETVTFPLATLTYQQQQQQRVQLEGWGWVSRERQLIHIPIEAAIDDLLAQQPAAVQAPDGGSPAPPSKEGP